MKIIRDKHLKDLTDRLNAISGNGNGSNSNSNNNNEITSSRNDDEYYIRTGQRPPRFQLYEQARWEKLTGQNEDVDNTITQDELNFILKQQLAMTPEARYQHRRNKLIWHDCGVGYAGVDCNPSCKFYLQEGRIEDQEIIDEHNRDVERMKQQGRIVNHHQKMKC